MNVFDVSLEIPIPMNNKLRHFGVGGSRETSPNMGGSKTDMHDVLCCIYTFV